MAARVGSLYVSLSANTTGLVKGLAAAFKAVDKFAKETKKISGDIANLSMVVTAAAGAALKLASEVNGPTKAAMDGLTRSTQQAAVPIAMMLIPAVKELSKEISTAGQYIAGLSPEMRGHIATAAKWGVELLVASKVIGSLSGVVSAFAGVASSLFGMLAGIGVATIGTIVVSIGIGIATVVALHAAWRTNFLGIKDITETIIENMKATFLGLFTFLVSGWEKLIDTITAMVDNWLTIIDTLQKKSGTNLIDVEGMRSGIQGLMGDLKSGSFFSDAFKFGKSTGSSIVDGMGSELKMMGTEVKDALKSVGIDLDSLFDFKKGKLAPVAKVLTPEQKVALQNSQNDVQGDMLQRLGLGATLKKNGWVNGTGDSPIPGLTTAQKGWTDGLALTGLAAANLTQEFVWSSEALKEMRSDALDALQIMPLSALPDAPTAPREAGRVGADYMARINDGGAQSRELMALVNKAAEAAKFNQAINNALSSVAEGISTAGQIFAGKFLSKMGEMGSLISETINAGVQGGPWAAIATVVAELLTKTKAFEEVVGTGNTIMTMLVQTVEPLMQAISGPLKRVLGIVYLVLSKVMRALQPVFDLVGVILDSVTPILVAVTAMFATLGPLLRMLIGPVTGLIKGLKPLFMLVFELVKIISFIVLSLSAVMNILFSFLGAPMTAIWGVLGKLGLALEGVMTMIDQAINWFFSGVTAVWNSVIEGLASAVDEAVKVISVGQVTNGGDFLRTLKGENSVTSAMGDLATMTWGTAGAMADFGDSVSATAQSFSESLSNVPSGFKTALARYNATSAEGGGFDPFNQSNWNPFGGRGGSSSDAVTITGDVYVSANTDSELLAHLKAAARKERFRKTGNPHP